MVVRGSRLASLVMLVVLSPSRLPAQSPPAPFTDELNAVVKGTEPYRVVPIGLTNAGTRLVALEPGTAVPTQRRVLLVGGLDGSLSSAQAVADVLRLRFASYARSGNRRRWQLAAVPCALPDRCGREGGTAGAPAIAWPPEKGFFDAPELRETRYLWRWATMLGPDLVIEVRDGAALEWRGNDLARGRVHTHGPAAPSSFAGALGTGGPAAPAPVAALQVSGPRAEVVKAVETLLTGLPAGEISPLRRSVEARRVRPPLEIAKVLAAKYPASPIMSYIPALSWIGALKVSQLTGDPQYRDRVRAQAAPFLTGARPSIAEPYLLTSLAGHQALADLGTLDGNAEAAALARKAADFILSDEPDEIVRFATSWTDDMFMATSVLARAAKATGDPKYEAAVSKLLTTYAERLQRDDGLFIHAKSGPHAWGRGNGFAAFGLIEALTHLPAEWPAREAVLEIYRRQMAALQSLQASDGAWHEVIDDVDSYHELTATAMITTAMTRGIRLGWLDRGDYGPTVEAGWRAVAARVSETGDLVDVCTGTGAGQNATREYYVNRPAISGPDDRGGAMALTAALEIHALRAAPR